MTRSMEKVLAEISKLPEAEQERFADWILEELSERRWNDLFARSVPMLDVLAEEADAEYRAGKTEPLDPSKL